VLRNVLLLVVCLALFVGCAGPNKLSRGLDERVNQLYVDNPILAEVLLPFTYVGVPLVLLVDVCFVNPWWFWSDVRVGRGSPYYYQDPITPDNPLPEVKPAGDGEVPLGSPASPAAPPVSTRPAGTEIPPPPSVVEPPRYSPYTVQAGDSLASISRRFYGTPQHWKKIYMANQAILTSPDAIKPGITLSIPTSP
jgi:hypothetical protein